MIDKPIVIVTWNDAHGSTSTHHETDLPHEPLEVKTVGWLLRDDATGVSICDEYCGDGDWRGHTFILRSMVVNIKIVKKPRKKRKSEESPSAQTSS